MSAGDDTLASLKLPTYINTRKEDVIELLYKPCLQASTRYVRGAGYFRTSVFRLMSEDILNFCINGGKITLLTSTEWGREDYETAIKAYKDYETTGIKEDLSALLNDPNTVEPTRMLCALIQNGNLSLHIAVLRGDIYHQKKGYFEDKHGNIVAFDGSGNETLSALKPYDEGNAESFSVGWSWEPLIWNMYGRAWKEDLDQTFDPNHDSTFPVVKIVDLDPDFIGKWDIDFSLKSHREAARQRHRKMRKKWDEVYGKETREERPPSISNLFEHPAINIPQDLYTHQKTGIRLWKESGKRGILEHATASGKTITAISAIKEQVESGGHAVVLVPSEYLLYQWEEEMRHFLPGISIALLGGGNSDDGILSEMRVSQETGSILLSTIQSFRIDRVQRKVKRLLKQGVEILLVSDECHRLGAPSYSGICSTIIPYTLGLSATPEVEGRPEATQRIIDLLGSIIDRYSLRDALEDGHLSPFDYHVHTTNLSPKEQRDYDDLRAKMKKALAMHIAGEPMSEYLEALIYKSRGIIRGAEGKIPKAVEILRSEFEPGQHWLIYCDNSEMMERVKEEIEVSMPIRPLTYWSGMDRFQRRETLRFFERNGGVILAIKCLDEGVDIPAISHGIVLSSSKTKREWIQRRGRLLRKSKLKSKSVIYDVLALPDSSGEEISFILDELARAAEFSLGSLNRPITHYELSRICREYSINITSVIGDVEEVE